MKPWWSYTKGPGYFELPAELRWAYSTFDGPIVAYEVAAMVYESTCRQCKGSGSVCDSCLRDGWHCDCNAVFEDDPIQYIDCPRCGGAGWVTREPRP